MSISLTRQQSRALSFMVKFQALDGCIPSYDEIAEGLNLASKSGVHRLIVALEERGYIRRIPNKARAIEIIRVPENCKPIKPCCKHCGGVL